MFKKLAIIGVLVGAVVLTGCSEQERREIRAKEERIARYEADQRRAAADYAAKLDAETQRWKNTLDAETDRQFNENLTGLAKLLGTLAAIGAVITFVIYSIRRLGERHLEERTKRHAQNLKAIEADPHLRPEDRRDLYRAAVEAANKGGTPLLGYAGSAGGAS